MNRARTRTRRSLFSTHHSSPGVPRPVPRAQYSKLLLAPLLCAVMASVSCGPNGKLSFGGIGRKGAPPSTSPEPLADPNPPFSTTDAGTNHAPAAQNDKATNGLDARVQTFVGQFPPDDRDRQNRKTPSQSPNPANPNTAQAAAKPQPASTGPTPRPVTDTTKPAPAVTTPAPTTRPAMTANHPAVTAMQPVVAQAAPSAPPPASATPSGTDAQASPQPMNINLLPQLESNQPKVELMDIRPASAPTTPPGTTDPLQQANTPVVQSGARGNDLTSMLVELEEAVKAHPEQLDNQFKLRLLYLATDQDDKANGPITAGDAVQAHLLTALFNVITATKAALRQPTASPAQALLAAEELRRLLGQQAPVIIPKIALVTRVNSFGDYEAVSPAKFPAGQGIHVFLYTEVSNFRSEPTPDGRLRTLLAETVEIFDSTGKVIWKQTADNIEDKVLSPRRDFFIPVEVRLPAATPPGEYVLKASIEDKLGATTDQQKMTLVIE